MPDFLVFSDLFRIARDEVLTRQPLLSLDAVDRDGSDANALLAACAATADEVVAQLVGVCAGSFLDSAEGQALDKLVFDRYNLARKPAAPAIGSVEFRTTVPNPAAFTIPIGVTLQTSAGAQYITTVGATFPALSVGPLILAVRSVLAGAGQQAKANTITNIVSRITGAAADLTVKNTLATAGADDAETDASLRDRARRFFVTARRGTIAALEEGAKAVAGVRTATAVEVLDALGRPARFVQLIVSDAFTDTLADLNVNPPAYQAQSQSLSQVVFAALSDVRAAGIYVQVFVAQVVLQPISLNLRFQAGVDADLVALFARAAITARVNSLSPGQPLVRADLAQVLQTVSGLAFQGDEITSPPGDVIPKALQVIRTSLNLVNVLAVVGDQPVELLKTVNPDAFVIRGITDGTFL